MAYTFDGPNKLIILSSGTTTFDAVDVYSRWKEWVATGDNAKYLLAFQVVGGEPISGSVTITPYVFLQNNWKIKPQAANHTLTITGNLLTSDSSSPMSFAGLTGYQIDVVRQLALKTETVSTSGSSSDPWTKVIENGFTAEQMLRLISSVLIGKTQIVPGAPGEATVYFRDIADTKDRVGAAMVGSERTGIALDAT
jgi:hypothetical protein